MSLEYELKWNNFNEFTEDGERVIDMPPNKVLLQSSDEGVTGGYYDGEGTWHEFGGGGGEIQPILHLKAINTSESALYIFDSSEKAMIVNNGHLDSPPYSDKVQPSETYEVDIVLWDNYGENFFGFAFRSTTKIESGVSLVNCSLHVEGGIIYGIDITDPTKEASATVNIGVGDL